MKVLHAFYSYLSEKSYTFVKHYLLIHKVFRYFKVVRFQVRWK